MYKKKKFEFIKIISSKSFVKNPIKGGTPAIENKQTVSVKVKKKLNFKSLNEYKVFKLKLMNCCNKAKINKSEKLYTDTYRYAVIKILLKLS